MQICQPASDRVAEGDYSPPAPTDPYVRTLAHTVPRIMDSLRVATHPMPEKCCSASVAIRNCFVDTSIEFRGIRRVSQSRFNNPTSRFPPLAPLGERSPASTVLSRRYDFLTPIPPRFVAFAWRYLGALVLFAPRWTSEPSRPGVW